MKAKSPSSNQVYFSESDIDYDDLTNICSQETLKDNYPLSDSISNNVVIYDAKDFGSFVGRSILQTKEKNSCTAYTATLCETDTDNAEFTLKTT